MGLDMHLTGEIYLFTDWMNPDNHPCEDGYRIKIRNLDLGYWRKHPDLHGFIVETFNEGVDDCRPLELDADALKRIITAIELGMLPKTEGFFFGESVNDAEQNQHSVTILKNAMTWLNTKMEGQWRSISYCASW
jgi:hypothetical protein